MPKSIFPLVHLFLKWIKPILRLLLLKQQQWQRRQQNLWGIFMGLSSSRLSVEKNGAALHFCSRAVVTVLSVMCFCLLSTWQMVWKTHCDTELASPLLWPRCPATRSSKNKSFCCYSVRLIRIANALVTVHNPGQYLEFSVLGHIQTKQRAVCELSELNGKRQHEDGTWFLCRCFSSGTCMDVGLLIGWHPLRKPHCCRYFAFTPLQQNPFIVCQHDGNN